MVDIVAQALHANNISHVKCANRNKDFTATGGVEVFRNNATVRVIVMPLALGAEGLDLIVASHVFLLEPLLNIHQELQAVNRISRLGQQKRTYVHKYVIANTIEERIVLVQNRTSSYTGGDSSDAGSGSGGVSGDVKSVYSPSKGHKQRSDDDFLSESDLCFILGIQAHTVGGNGDTGAHSAHATDNTIQVEGNVAAIGSVGDFGRGAAAVLTATINGGENGVVAASNSVEGGDGHGSDGGGEDESFGVMDLSSNLLDHFE